MKTKSTSQTPRTRSKNAILLAITALALCAWPIVALAADCPNKGVTVWTGAVDHNWFNPGNWTNGIPTCNDIVSSTAGINNGGTAQINYPNAFACDVTLGANATDSGNLSVAGSGGNLTTCRDISVGYQGKGSLSITNGGVVTTDTGASIAWGATSTTSSNGAVTVKGTNSTWAVGLELDIGGTTNAAGGTGLLTVTSSATVTAASVHVWNSGTLTGNSTVSTTNGMTVDGTISPNGGGGTLTFGGGLSFSGLATTQCKVTPQDPSATPQVSVSAQVSLGGRLSVTMTGDFSSAPTRFTLLHAASVDFVHRTFDSQSITYPTGQGCWIPQITYDYSGGHVSVYLDRVINCN